MACVITISDGTTTVTLTSTNASLDSYVPAVGNASDATVTEQAIVDWLGTAATVRANVNLLNGLFNQARLYDSRKVGVPVYVNFKPDGADSVAYRSLLHDGRIEFSSGLLGATWISGMIEATIIWTRDNYWEGAEASVTATANGAAGTTVTLYNRNDAVGHNCAVIYSNAVLGELPTPAKIQITAGSGCGTYGFILANCVHAPTFRDSETAHDLEAEAGSGGSGVDQAQANASGGHYLQYTAVSSGILRSWTNQPATNDANYYHLILKSYAAVTTADFWLYYQLSNAVATLDVGRKVHSRASWYQDLGAMEIPPGLIATSPQNLVYAAYGYKPSGGTYTLDIDAANLLCADSFRRYVGIDATNEGALPIVALANTEALVDDPYLGNIYSIRSAARVSDFTPQGAPILLWPGLQQRLYLLADDAPQRTYSVVMTYRARRLQL